MKHLKRFNESLQPNEVEELKGFCESSLAYLLDEDFQLIVSSPEYSDVSNVTIQRESGTFRWDQIKDCFIPFLQLLSKRYELEDFSINDRRNGLYLFVQFLGIRDYEYTTLEKVIDDDVPIPRGELWFISIKVKNKI